MNDMLGYLVLALVGLFILVKLSTLIAPMKRCSRCSARGMLPGALGGMRHCPRCGGAGLVRRWFGNG